ncbi:hypothetical protein H2201_004639 [Coniosporium apollinis]|uniref:Mid2 domain-containing protein n=2 Tax=Coniosporium TaxID=2810619 RepID=A0ABQ9NZ14_9PEZI|nr:hypothetical protein H2199_006695 [Cladosporium sp. JES 115]KAJ9665347.1 hypothetical protein H2201_004639 [Coniosporium apollinis]
MKKLLRLTISICLIASIAGTTAKADSHAQFYGLNPRQERASSSSSSSSTRATRSNASSTRPASNATSTSAGNVTLDVGLRTCQTRDFRTGECRTVTSCSTLNGTYETGYCPEFGDNIRCCLWGVCVIPEPVRMRGYCQRVSTCNGTSTPGFCSGPNDIQCCTHGNASTGQGGTEDADLTSSALTSSVPATASSVLPTAAPTAGPANDSGLDTRSRIGIGVGVSIGAVVLGFLLGLWWWLRRARRERATVSNVTTVEETAGVPIQEAGHNSIFQMATRVDVAELQSPVSPAELDGKEPAAVELDGDAARKSLPFVGGLVKGY